MAKKLKKCLFFGIFALFLAGPSALGYIPDEVNAGGGVYGFFGYRAYSGPEKPLRDSGGANFENLGYFRDCQSFHKVIIDENLKKVNNFKRQVIDKPVVYVYDVSIGDRNMAEIINFLEARDRLVLNSVKERLRREQEEREEWEARQPRKKAEIVQILPGDAMPPEYDEKWNDLRPLLQRDGLILLSWAVRKTHSLLQWTKIYEIPYKTVDNRLKRGWSLEKALGVKK